MIRSFADRATEDLWLDRQTKANRQAHAVWAVARRKLDYLDAARDLADLKVPPGNRLEALHGRRAGQHSVRINDQFRLCFAWTPEGPAEVEFVDYHDERR